MAQISTGCTKRLFYFVKSINAIELKISAISIIIILGYHAKNQDCKLCFNSVHSTVSESAADFYLVAQKVSFLEKLFHFLWFFKLDFQTF